MKNVLRGILALVLGLVIGSAVNMAMIVAGSRIVPPPPGVVITDAESLRASMHLLEPKHFMVPLVAHALGTLVGALAAYFIASRHRPIFAYVVGLVFLAGGIAAASMVGGPAWFVALDLLVAYIPMAWLATVIGRRVIHSAAAPSAM